MGPHDARRAGAAQGAAATPISKLENRPVVSRRPGACSHEFLVRGKHGIKKD